MTDLKIEEGGVGLAANELEGAEEDADADSDAIGEEEGLAEVADGVGDARLAGAVIAGRAVRLVVVVVEGGGGAAMAALELLDGFAEALFGLAEAAVGVGIVGDRRRGRRRLFHCQKF